MRLRSIAAALSVALLSTAVVPAASVELTPFWGYRFGGELEDVDLEATDSDSYGIVFDLAVDRYNAFEFLWSRQDTAFEFNDFVGGVEREIGITIDHYQFGWLVQGGDEKIKPFFTFHLGWGDFDPDRGNGETEFNWSLGGGAKVFFNDQLGMRLGVRWTPTYVDSDPAYFCDAFGFCYSVSDYDYFNQVEMSVGLIIRLGS